MFAPLTLVAVLASMALATDSSPDVTTVGFSWGQKRANSCVSGKNPPNQSFETYVDGTELKHGACGFRPVQGWDIKFGIGPIKSFPQPDMCLDAGDMKEGTRLTTAACVEGSPRQNWNVRKDRLFELVDSGLCIALTGEPTAGPVSLAPCNETDEHQVMHLEENKNSSSGPYVEVPTHDGGDGGKGDVEGGDVEGGDVEGGDGGKGDVNTGDAPKPKPHCKPKKRSLRSRK